MEWTLCLLCALGAMVPTVAAAEDLVAFTVSENLADQPEAGVAPLDYSCGACGDCESCCVPQCCDCGPLWTARVGAIVLERDNPDSHAALTDRTRGTTRLDNDDFDFDFEAGMDVQLFRHFCGGERALEFRYFGIDGWSANQSGTLAGTSNLNANPPVVVAPGDFDSTYHSELFSTEMNLRQRRGENFWLLAGFRYVELNEDVDTDFTFPASSASYRIDADNRMYGFQIGADGVFWNRGRLSVNSWVKAGIYYNDADHHSIITQTAGPTFGPVDEEDEVVSFLGEVAIIGTYQLTDHLGLYSGYQLLWIDGVAIASDQVAETNFAGGTGIDTEGGTFFHGGLLGVQYTY